MKSRDESGGGGGSTVMPPLDRSKVRILLCDNDVKSSKEAFELLCKCSYQVTAVRTPRQVIDALNAEGPEIDIILAEVDLPVSKGLKMLKYLMRDIELRRIPIIMMSAQDEVSVVVKCLKLGAADYLVKPLRTNELLNLWTHMWKRRRMLGLTEKNILNSDFDMVASDPSDANTNSTTLFSDDTDDKSRRSTLPAKSTSSNREDESNNAASVDPLFNSSSEYPPDLLRSSEQIAQISSCPKKSELKFGESSAFFTYVKSSTPLSKCQRIECLDGTSAKSEHSNREGNRQTRCQPDVDIQRHKIREAWENYYSGNGFPSGDSGPHTIYTERSCTPMQSKFPHVLNPKEQLSMDLMHQSNVAQVNVSSYPALTQFPFYVSGIMNHVMMPPATRQCQSNQNDFLKHTITSTLPQYGSLSQCSPHAPMMSSYPYYPVRMCMQPENMPTTHLWPPVASSPSAEGKLVRIERREAALIKFRQKRKDRCFDKKIRYINRKHLAERRPRVGGQFVGRINGVDVDCNGQQVNVEDSDEDDEEEEEELVSRDYSLDGNASRCQR